MFPLLSVSDSLLELAVEPTKPWAMQLLGLQGLMLPSKRMSELTSKCVTRLGREREKDREGLPPGGGGPCGPWREQVSLP